MRIIGIDPGTASTGYGVIEVINGNEKPTLIATSVISTRAKSYMPNRLQIIYKELLGLVDEFEPEIMVVERLFFNTNVKTAMSVGQARGIPLLVAADKGLSLIEYTALEAKLSIAGYGRANKKELQGAVRKYLGLDEVIKPDDANDAVAMALCYYHKEILDFQK